MTPKQQEALDAIAEHGSKRAAARALGINKSSLQDRLRGIDPAIQDAMHAVQTDLVPALAWAKTKSEDGTSYSVLLKPPQEPQQDIAARIAAAFSDIPAAPEVAPPHEVAENMCVLYPLYDVHWGMHAWGEETGGDDYDLKLARSDLVTAFERLLFKQPPAKQSILLIGGDFFHADDSRNVTPGHGHHLDSDGRIFKVIDTAIQTLDHIIRRMQTKSESVLIRVLRGNHDEHSHTNLTFGLDGRFRDSRARVEKSPRDLSHFQWGQCGIFGQHGDKQSHKEWVGKLSDAIPTYSATPYRYAYSGHKHRLEAEIVYGTHWERLHPFCPPDAYGSNWVNRRAMKFDIFEKDTGRTMTALDPLRRAA